jgi:hypothetical protein
MKRTRLTAILVGFAAVGVLSQDAFARERMYHPGLGRFMQRDPVGTPVEQPIGRNLSGTQFTQRDQTEQYADGPNLYQYTRSSPVVFLDPQGTRVVIVTGFGEPASKGGPLAEDITRELVQALKVAGLDRGEPTVAVELEGGGGWGPQGALETHYKRFVENKDKNPCSLEQFAAIGHSDGAAAVFNLLKDGKFNGNAKTGFWTPAVLVTVDLVRTSYLNPFGNTDAGTTEAVTKPASCAVANFRQTIGVPLGWKGRILQGASINVDVNPDAQIPGLNIANPMQGKNLNHFQSFYDPAARKVYAQVIAKAYVWKVKEEKQAKLLEPRRFGVEGSDLSKKGAPW